MRKTVAVAGLLGLTLLGLGMPAERADAGATVDLLFVGRNGARITPTDSVRVGEDVRIGDLLTLAIRLRNDIPLTVVVFSLRYDLDGGHELEVSSAFQWRGVALSKNGGDVFPPIGPLSPATKDLVGSLQGWAAPLPRPR